MPHLSSKKAKLLYVHIQFKNRENCLFLITHHVSHGLLQGLNDSRLKNNVLQQLWHYIFFILTVWYSWGTVCCAPRLHTCLALFISSLHFCNNRCLLSSNSMKCCYYKKKMGMLLLNQKAVLLNHHISNKLLNGDYDIIQSFQPYCKSRLLLL